MAFEKWLSGIVVCCLIGGLATEARQTPARDSYAAHLKAAKDAARFDWTGILARNCIAPDVGPAIGNYSTDPGRDAYYAEPGHLPLVHAGTEIVEFSPTDLLRQTMGVIGTNMAAMSAG